MVDSFYLHLTSDLIIYWRKREYGVCKFDNWMVCNYYQLHLGTMFVI